MGGFILPFCIVSEFASRTTAMPDHFEVAQIDFQSVNLGIVRAKSPTVRTAVSF